MAKSSIFLVLLCLILLSLGKSEAQLAPALYVFGDSTVDAGNNNLIDSFAKSNYAPYGLDFPGGVTGRATNGHTMADSIGMFKRTALNSQNMLQYSIVKNYDSLA